MMSARTTANLLAAAAAFGATVLYRFSPREYSFYPTCPFFALTHHYCPGCGATRAIAELLRGHFGAALHFNAMVTILLPFLLCYSGNMYWVAIREDRIEWRAVPAWTWRLAVACLAVFGFVRMFTQSSL